MTVPVKHATAGLLLEFPGLHPAELSHRDAYDQIGLRKLSASVGIFELLEAISLLDPLLSIGTPSS